MMPGALVGQLCDGDMDAVLFLKDDRKPSVVYRDGEIIMLTTALVAGHRVARGVSGNEQEKTMRRIFVGLVACCVCRDRSERAAAFHRTRAASHAGSACRPGRASAK